MSGKSQTYWRRSTRGPQTQSEHFCCEDRWQSWAFFSLEKTSVRPYYSLSTFQRILKKKQTEFWTASVVTGNGLQGIPPSQKRVGLHQPFGRNSWLWGFWGTATSPRASQITAFLEVLKVRLYEALCSLVYEVSLPMEEVLAIRLPLPT